VNRQLGTCSETVAGLDTLTRNMPQTATYRMLRDGLVVISRKDIPLNEVWKIDLVTSDVNSPAISLKQGDLIMQMISPQKQVIWRRFLRRLPQN
jgi:hypothetical protein